MMVHTALKDPKSLQPEAAAILNAMPHPVIMVDQAMHIEYVNDSAEQFFAASAAMLLGHPLNDVMAFDSPALSLVKQVIKDGISVNEYGVEIGTAKAGDK